LGSKFPEQGIVIGSKDKLLIIKSGEIATLEEYIRYMTQQRFGRSSENSQPINRNN